MKRLFKGVLDISEKLPGKHPWWSSINVKFHLRQISMYEFNDSFGRSSTSLNTSATDLQIFITEFFFLLKKN